MKISKNMLLIFGLLFLASVDVISASAHKLPGCKMTVSCNGTDFHLIEGDILDLDVDAIVNPANKSLRHLGGLCGAIHDKAGPQLEEECLKLLVVEDPDTRCKSGNAIMTKGYNLKAKHVIHAVGPVYANNSNPAEELAATYINALECADRRNLKSIAIPAISTGIFGYPSEEATKIAIKTVLGFDPLGFGGHYDTSSITHVYFVVRPSLTKIYERHLNQCHSHLCAPFQLQHT